MAAIRPALASSQYGPRLLRSFVRDTGNQVVLSTFVATHLYCLLVLRTIRGQDNGPVVPQLSVTVGVVLAIASLGVLIYFIDHVATTIRADRVVAAVGHELDLALEQLFPAAIGDDTPARGQGELAADLPVGFEQEARALSPGINDPFTAITCIDRLGAALVRLATEPFPVPYRYDDEGRLRVVADPLDFGERVDAAFEQIRIYGRGNVLIMERLLVTLGRIGAAAVDEGRRTAVCERADLALATSLAALTSDADRRTLEAQHRAAWGETRVERA